MTKLSTCFVGAAAIAALLSGCVQDGEPETLVEVSIPLINDQCGVYQARAEVTAEDIPSPVTGYLNTYGDDLTGTISQVPAGEERSLSVTAYNAYGQPVYAGTTMVDVIDGQTTQARIVLYRNWQTCPATGGAGDIEVIGNLDNTPPPGGDLRGNFGFSDARQASNGVVYFLVNGGSRIRRLDIATRTFLEPLVGTLSPIVAFTASPDGAQVYVTYTGGRIDVIDAATGRAKLFATAPGTISALTVAGTSLFTIESTSSRVTHALYSLEGGARTATSDYRSTGRELVYSPLNGTVYFLPGDYGYGYDAIAVSTVGGVIGSEIRSPYRGEYYRHSALRLSPDEQMVVVSNGMQFNASDLSYSSSFGLSFVDVAYHGGLAYLVSSQDGQTQIRAIDEANEIVASHTLPATPLRAFVQGDELVVLTQVQAGRFDVRFLPLPLQ